MKWHAPRSEQMSIAVEDWDDLAVAGDRRDERRRGAAPAREAAAPEAAGAAGRRRGAAPVAEAREAAAAGSPPAVSAAPERARAATTETVAEAAPTLGYYKHEDDSYGDVLETFRVPASIAAGNAVFWLVGRLFGVVELIGVASLVSVGLLLAAYVLREWHRDRTALICLAGALPLPLTIFGLLS
jgi:hypothetical protein